MFLSRLVYMGIEERIKRRIKIESSEDDNYFMNPACDINRLHIQLIIKMCWLWCCSFFISWGFFWGGGHLCSLLKSQWGYFSVFFVFFSQLQLSTSPAKKVHHPMTNVEIQLKGSPHATVGLSAVDKAVYLINDKNKLTRKLVSRILLDKKN